MAGKFDLDAYETVELRLRRLYTKFPEARVLTDLVFHNDRSFIVKAEIYLDRDDVTPVATGYAEEIVGASPVNKTSALENGETSAIGRAISNSVLCLDAPVGARPSRSEMEKVERYGKEPRMSATKPREYSETEVKQAEDLMTLLPTITSIDVLRSSFAGNAEILELPINGTTLKDLFHARAQELKGE
jgi:hypothetical protein